MAGLRPGDIILAVNRQPVARLRQLNNALRGVIQILAFNLLRDNSEIFLVIQ